MLRVPLLPCITRKLTYCPAVRLSVTDALLPIQQEYGRILADKAYVDGVLKDGAARAARIADRTVAKVYRKVGLLQPEK